MNSATTLMTPHPTEGLNYQIEHHLFPRISHEHYPTVAKVVKQFCKEKEIPYHYFNSFTGNVSSFFGFMRALAHEHTE
jgi:fatty acid desaturase